MSTAAQRTTADTAVEPPWHVLSTEETAARLGSAASGLAQEEAARRLERDGPNVVEAERLVPWWRLLLHQFTDPLIYILIAAAGVTLVLRDYADAGVILAVVLLNAVIGFYQEMRAREAIRGLTRLAAPRAEVLRDGGIRTIDSRELVVGDRVLLASGARVPADLRLVQVRDLAADESALTGESLPVRKQVDSLDSVDVLPADRTNMVFAGTIVTRGRGQGIVVRTGLRTQLGRIAESIRTTRATPTPLQLHLARFSRQIGAVILLLGAAMVPLGLLRGLSPAELFLAAVAMAVSAIPEGLPVVMTVTLAIGVNRMARRRAIIRALPAVETLGSTTVIASDKTGTLTKNEMTVRAVWTADRFHRVTGVGYRAEGSIEPEADGDEAGDDSPGVRETLLAGVLANESTYDGAEAHGDPTEVALHVSAAKLGFEAEAVRGLHAELDLLPFEPERRLMASLRADPDGATRIYVKGAPEAVLAHCDRVLGPAGPRPLDPGVVLEAARDLADRGLRVLAFARGEYPEPRLAPDAPGRNLVLLGLQGMEDPIRPEAMDAVEAARTAGIRVIMLTGDHARTAGVVGRRLGLGGPDGEVVEGRALEHMKDDTLDPVVRRVDIYARVAPEHKLRLVETLQRQDYVVAVTGDGVNDAPALRRADLGIAMGASGTDVAREAADVILADDNFATITAAIEEGRVVFSNIRKVTFFLLSTAAGEVMTIMAALALGWPLPFVAVQILWINLVTNGLQDVALAFEPGEPDLLKRRPRPLREGLLTRSLLRRLGSVGVVLALGTLGVFYMAWTATGDVDYARTIAMTQMVVFQFFHVFNCRSLDRSVFRISAFSNRFLFISLIAATAAHVAVVYVPVLQVLFRTVPIGAGDWLLLFGVGILVIVGGEIDKAWHRRRGVTLA